MQISDELGFSPAGLGLAVSAYFGASALASVPAGALVERYGSRRVSRYGDRLAAASLLGIGIAARSLWSLIAIMVTRRRRERGGPARQQHQPGPARAAPAAGPVVRREAGRHPGQHAARRCGRTGGGTDLGLAMGVRAGGRAGRAAIAVVPAELRTSDARGPGPADRATGALVVIGVAATLAAGAANALGTFLVDSAVARRHRTRAGRSRPHAGRRGLRGGPHPRRMAGRPPAAPAGRHDRGVAGLRRRRTAAAGRAGDIRPGRRRGARLRARAGAGPAC